MIDKSSSSYIQVHLLIIQVAIKQRCYSRVICMFCKAEQSGGLEKEVFLLILHF